MILVEGPTEEMFINTFLDKEVEYLNEIEVIAIGQKGYKTFLTSGYRYTKRIQLPE
ncbi:MAG: TOPRIM nucleotidyl transferase/hydrolase domain-containing protein [Faecalibacillus sp.]